jgi:hypothetical protein
MRTSCEIDDYSSLDIKSCKPKVIIESDWISNDKVTIKIGNEERSIYGSELIKAIENCMHNN